MIAAVGASVRMEASQYDDNVFEPVLSNASSLPKIIAQFTAKCAQDIDLNRWVFRRYMPTPTIIQAMTMRRRIDITAGGSMFRVTFSGGGYSSPTTFFCSSQSAGMLMWVGVSLRVVGKTESNRGHGRREFL